MRVSDAIRKKPTDASLHQSAQVFDFVEKSGLVPGAGIEPARLAAGDFESPASTNFTTRAALAKPQIMAQCRL